MSMTMKIGAKYLWINTASEMISENHLRFLAITYYIVSYITAFSLWFTHEVHTICFGWTIFLFNTYQIFTELHENQSEDEN